MALGLSRGFTVDHVYHPPASRPHARVSGAGHGWRMSFREIEETDLDTVMDLLSEGFPRRRKAFWRRGLKNMHALPAIADKPRYGFLLEEDGAPQGVILQLNTRTPEGGSRANVACWYVREAYRAKAAILYKLVSDQDIGMLTNISPADHVVPIAKLFGFHPYTVGVWLIDARAGWRRNNGWRVRRYRPGHEDNLPAQIEEIAKRHHHYGCTVLLLQKGSEVPELLIYRLKWIKSVLPCAQLLYGSPALVEAAAGPLMRYLLFHGICLALVDVADSSPPEAEGRCYPGRSLRYAKGGRPAVGDLLDSEFAIFGP